MESWLIDGHVYEDGHGRRGLCRCMESRCLIVWPEWIIEIYERDGTPYTKNARRIAREVGPL